MKDFKGKLPPVTRDMLVTRFQMERIQRQEAGAWNVLFIIVMVGIVLRLVFEVVNRW